MTYKSEMAVADPYYLRWGVVNFSPIFRESGQNVLGTSRIPR